MKSRLLFVLIFAFNWAALGQPKLSIDRPELDLGIIYNGQKKSGKITLKNIGSDTLKIFSVVPQCGCTTVKRPKELLLPNESDAVEIEFNSRGYHGSVTKYVDIMTNDPASAKMTFKLIAEVKEELQMLGSIGNTLFGNVLVGATIVKDIQLKNITDHAIKIKTDKPLSPSLKIKANKNIVTPNDTLTLTVSIKAEKSGYWNEYFSVETDSKNQPTIEIRISYVGTNQQ